jgi:nitrite reductase/ring-hydroxylating ferredoxin subunit
MTDDSPKNRPDCTKPNCLVRSVNRRTFLSATGASAGLMLATTVVSGCGNQKGSPPSGPVSAGNVSALSVGTLLVMDNVVLARDAGGVYAMSAVCTHQGCLIVDSASTIASGLHCPCHGSAFDGNGLVTNGPARTDLQHYAVTIAADGGVTIDGSQPVSAGTRTPVA